ncbi:tetratricopeptide repeat protein [Aquicoccus sp. SCR17]|nr:tetratricopeptide repeat protein [Carideicomes alvinocaridis]
MQTRLIRAEKLTEAGQLGESERILRDVLDRYPGNRRARRGLRQVTQAQEAAKAPPDRLQALQGLCDRRDWPRALSEADLLAALWPQDPDVQHARAVIRLARDDIVAAMEGCTRALRLDPDHAPAAQALGRVLLRLERPGDAVTCFLDALRTAPGMVAAHRGLGQALLLLDRPEEAARAFAAAADRAPEDVSLQLALAEALIATGDGSGAEAAYDAAQRIDPDNAEAAHRRAVLLRNTGRFDAAREAALHALSLRPDHCAAWANLAQLHRFAPDDPLLARLDALLPGEGLAPRDRAHLHFARGKAAEDIGRTADAFDHFTRGNALREAEADHDVAQDRVQFDRLRRAFSHPLPPPLDGAEARHRSIFITGMPRSGTTLCEQILASHPEVAALGERDLLAPAVNAARIGEGPVGRDQLMEIRRGYLGALDRAAPGAAVVTDKMPFNFRLIGHILLALPEARVLHMRRDPRATCWSNFRTNFEESGPALGYARRLDSIVAYHRLHDSLMDFWHEVFPGRIHEVAYERLTETPERSIRALVAAAGLDWDPACLEFHRSKRLVRTASDAQVRRPIFTGSSRDWRRYEAHLGLLTEIWGSGPEPGDPS